MVGKTISHYKVLEKIGEGGMGEVYRATDTKLNRDVALKILPQQFASDSQRMGRFQREAEVLASLDHPNIGQIYGIEDAGQTKALVLQLIEGPTLAERIAKGPIPVEDALKIALQMAEGLEAAHEKGVIHRDLKPANIKITPEGQVKILDFGLAKALEGETPPDSSLSQSPTLTAAATQAGVILGTAAYMSPEQASGEATDKRADIWSFGVVLFEMLTGRQLFTGKTVSHVLADVLRAEPDWNSLPANLHSRLRVLLERCLDKEAKDRLSGISDARVDIQKVLTDPIGVLVQPVAEVVQPQSKLPWVAGIALAVITGLAVWILAPQPTRSVARFVVGTSATEPLSPNAGTRDLAISSDGTRIVYRSSSGRGAHVYLRQMDQLEGTRLFSTQNNITNPFFSPDGAWVVFSTGDGTWKKVSTLGGPPVTLFPNGGASPRGASWGPDDTIIFARAIGDTGLLRVPAAGGDPEVLTTLDAEQGEINHRWPEILPGGDAVLFTIVKGPGAGNMEIAVLDLATGERKVLVRGGSNPLYALTGHIIYGVDGTLLAVPFDLDRLEVTGEPVPVLEGVMTDPSGAVEFTLSADGSLVYVAGEPQGGPLRSLVWVDRQGKEEPLRAPPRAYNYPRISPDGTRVALDLRDQEEDIWIWDLTRETLTRLTFDPDQDYYPVWTPDSQRVAFSSAREGQRNLFWKAAEGTGSVERLTESSNIQYAYSFSADGEALVFRETQPDTGDDLRMLSLVEDRAVKTLVATQFRERNAELSPDGNWMAYQSNASGQDQIYVRPFPAVDEGQWMISTSGGTHPLWAPDGRELFYLSDPALMAVPIQTDPSFMPGTPELLFEGDYRAGQGRSYDVAPDGQQFLMIKWVVPSDEGSNAPELIIVENWFEELKERVPVP